MVVVVVFKIRPTSNSRNTDRMIGADMLWWPSLSSSPSLPSTAHALHSPSPTSSADAGWCHSAMGVMCLH